MKATIKTPEPAPPPAAIIVMDLAMEEARLLRTVLSGYVRAVGSSDSPRLQQFALDLEQILVNFRLPLLF